MSNHIELPEAHHSTPYTLSFPSHHSHLCWRLDYPPIANKPPGISYSTGSLESDDCDVFLFVNNTAYNLIGIDYPFTSLTLGFITMEVWNLPFHFILRRLIFLSRVYQPYFNTHLFQQRDSQRTRLITTPFFCNITARTPSQQRSSQNCKQPHQCCDPSWGNCSRNWLRVITPHPEAIQEEPFH